MALNPVAFTESVVRDFLRYQLTTYPLADTDLYAQMRALLQLDASQSTPLRQGPFISLSRPFKQGSTVRKLIVDGIFHPHMAAVVPFPSVRAHQDKAIRAIHAKRPTLVATGTGSGKTEAFLYPIISRCLELKDADAAPGIAAVLIYPMNALAEDQLDRMRGLLAGTGIPFGMYVGKTPNKESQVQGERMPPGSSQADYAARLTQLREAGLPTTLHPAEERASRESMRTPGGQPRILLTNTKQLELLLTRGKDVRLFDDALLDFLVFDEAHTFRGAQGGETACLIRRLRTFCRRSAEQTVCIATSATMADPERGLDAGKDFARRFFGVDGEQVELVGEIYDEVRWNRLDAHAPAPPEDPAALLDEVLRAVDLPDDQVGGALSKCITALGGAALDPDHWQAELHRQLATNELVFQLARVLERPRTLSELPDALAQVIERPVTEAEVLVWLALGAACARGGHDPMLRPVVHTFIRGVGGAVITLTGPESAAQLWLAGEDADEALGEGIQRFPLLSCTTCGQHYYEGWLEDFTLTTKSPEGGDVVGTRRVWKHLAEELGGDRILLVDRLVVSSGEDDDEAPQTAPTTNAHSWSHRRLAPVWMCRHCGGLQIDHSDECGACARAGGLVPLQAVRHREEREGQLHSCVCCQAPGRRLRGRYREPARPVRAVGVSDVHVLAQSMVHLSERRRLLVFADNRQDAAFQAGWMRDHARRFRFRALLSQQIPVDGASIGDVVANLDKVLEADRALSRALIPEVWQVHHFEDASTRHREERRYFLRLQVLREVATGVKQRFGLEPWGRLKVEYVGLTAELPLFQAWGEILGLAPEALVEAVAGILDHHRRTRMLHDATTRLFGIWWNAGDKEIQRGYFPSFPGGPKGVMKTRRAENEPSRAAQWRGTRPTQVWNAMGIWGLSEEQTDTFLDELWSLLVRLELLVPAQITGWGKPLRGSSGVYQVNAGKLRLHPHEGRWRCRKCRRTTVRTTPTGRCSAWRCGGQHEWETESGDNFDLRLLDGDYAMLRVSEHSAQVPARRREIIENQFKGDGEQLNTLVCTPTLELGVDIGALDAVLMRNVPPTAANYWQRAGRAGRRHRMAVDITYAQARGFDQSYFRQPLKLLEGLVEPPSFNLKNTLMVRKHVHATVLTTLLQLARTLPGDEGPPISEALGRCFPPTLRNYLFTPGGEVLPVAFDVMELGVVIRRYREELRSAVERAFTTAWPKEDEDAVEPARLQAIIDDMGKSLGEVVARFKRRLDWALEQLEQLREIERKKGALDPEDKAHRRRCERLVQRFKGRFKRGKGQAQGGSMDSDTMGALAREGFLPGYGLESGSIVGTAEPPRLTEGLSDFELARAPSLALREYVPGNVIYANGFRFVPRHFQLTADDTLRFRIAIEQQAVHEVGKDEGGGGLVHHEIRAVPVCDVVMPSQSHISDEEEFRFQMPVATYGNDRGYHRGGVAYTYGELPLKFRRGVRVRMVNVGPRGEVDQERLGYPVCLACGYSLSPYASREAQKSFAETHLERCDHVVEPTGFYADVEVDVLGLHDVEDRTLGFSIAESLRMGAARVLDMELSDLQIMALGRPGETQVDIFLYDPMPGGSGLLQHLCGRWDEVVRAALEILEGCPGACEHSCIDCLQTYRNRFYHEFLDRHRAAEVFLAGGSELVQTHLIPEKIPTSSTITGQPQTWLEGRFKSLLDAAGLPAPTCQKTIHLGPGFGVTIPDFFYKGDDEEDDPGVCIYLDGMAGHIHGNAEQREKDEFLRNRLRQLEYRVVAVKSFEIDDKPAMVKVIARIAGWVVAPSRRKALRSDDSWFDGRIATPPARPRLRLLEGGEAVGKTVLPVFDLRVAAGAFSEGQAPQPLGYVEVPEARPDRFVAQVIGDSMDRVAPKGAWCVWEHLGAATASGPATSEDLIVRRAGNHDPDLGEFTFKRLMESDSGRSLVPVSSNPAHKAIPLGEDDEIEAVARFVRVLELG